MWREGIITTDDNEIIARPEMTPDELRATRFAAGGRFWKSPTSPRHQHISSTLFRIGRLRWQGGANFLDDRLANFTLLLSEDEAKQMFGVRHPNDYVDELEFYKEWVKKLTGDSPPLQLSWGAIGADYDTKGMNCSIYLKYSPR